MQKAPALGESDLRRSMAGWVAEGEELGSNLLQVCLRSPASNYASGIPALATKHTYELIFGVPRLRSNRRNPFSPRRP